MSRLSLRPPLRPLWSFTRTAATPLVSGGHAFVWDAERDALVCVDPEGNARWTGQSASYALDEQHLVSVTHKSPYELVVYRLEDGAVVRRRPCDASIRVLLPERRAFVGNATRLVPDVYDQTLALVSYGERAEVFWEVSNRINYGVSIEDRVPDFDFDIACDSEAIYVGRGNELLSLNLRDGRVRWATSLKGLGGGPMLGGWVPMVSDGHVVINVGDGTAAFSVATGDLRWAFPRAGGRAIYHGRLYLVSQGNYHVLEVATGRCVLEVALSDRVEKKWKLRGVGFPTYVGISETHGFVGDYRGRLIAFERDTGEPVWKHQPEGIVGFSGNIPVIAGNRLCISSFSMDPARPASALLSKLKEADHRLEDAGLVEVEKAVYLSLISPTTGEAFLLTLAESRQTPIFDHLAGRTLLLVDQLDLGGKETGAYDIAVDTVQAGPGDTVLVMDEGTGARQILGLDPGAIRCVVVGVVDEVTVGG